MKYRLPLFICIILSFIFINGCSGKVNNLITFKNLSQGNIYVNFRGEAIPVTTGNSSIVQEIPKGIYNYATTFSVPAGVISSTSQGAVSGNLTIVAETKILIIYSSTLINGTYTLFANLSSSDNQGTPSGP